MSDSAIDNVRILAVSFRNSSASGLNQAFRLRETPADDWDWSAAAPLAPAPVAYATLAPNADQVSVWVQVQNLTRHAVEVRATFDTGSGLLGSGISHPTEVEPGKAAVVEVPLRAERLRGHGVDHGCLVWRSTIQLPDGSTPDRAAAVHPFYTTLCEPYLPWSPVPSEDAELPWGELLEFVCEWARGARDPDTAASMVAQAIFDLGRKPYPNETQPYFHYRQAPTYTDLEPSSPGSVDLQSLGSQRAPGTYGSFFGNRFVRRLQGVASADCGLANCTDFATMVSTSANLLGCRMAQFRISDHEFHLNPVVFLGSPADGWCFDPEQLTWISHDVAWAGEPNTKGLVWDACVAVDMEGNPAEEPRREEIARGLRLGEAGDKRGYRYRLVVETGRYVLSMPLEYHVVRPLRPDGQVALLSKGRLQPLESVVAVVPEELHVQAMTQLELLRDIEIVPAWYFSAFNPIPEIRWSTALEAKWKTIPEAPAQHSIYLRVHLCSDSENSEQVFEAFRAQIHTKAAREPLEAAIGEQNFGLPNELVFFRRGQAVVSLARCGCQPLSLIQHAQMLDQRLIQVLSLG